MKISLVIVKTFKYHINPNLPSSRNKADTSVLNGPSSIVSAATVKWYVREGKRLPTVS